MDTTTSPPAALLPRDTPSQPWWRHGYVWLVIAGPLIVVVAGFFTLWLAIRTPDPVLPAADLPRALPQQHMGAGQGSMAPAQAVRNHAASTLGSAQ